MPDTPRCGEWCGKADALKLVTIHFTTHFWELVHQLQYGIFVVPQFLVSCLSEREMTRCCVAAAQLPSSSAPFSMVRAEAKNKMLRSKCRWGKRTLILKARAPGQVEVSTSFWRRYLVASVDKSPGTELSGEQVK